MKPIRDATQGRQSPSAVRWRASSCYVLASAIVLVAFPAWTVAETPAVAAPVHGKLSIVEGIRVLSLWGAPEERGYAQGLLLGHDIVQLLDAWVSRGLQSARAEARGSHAFAESQRITRAVFDWPDAFQAELRGLLRGIEAAHEGPAHVPALGRPISFDDLLTINALPELSMLGCSSFAAWGPLTHDHLTLAGRNLDWHAVPSLAEAQIVTVYGADERHQRLGWVSVTWPGFIGCLTGMNGEGVTLSMHDVSVLPPAEAMALLAPSADSTPRDRPSPPFLPRGLILREAIESARSQTAREDIDRVLRRHRSLTGNNLPVSLPFRGTEPASLVFEYDGHVGTQGGLMVRAAKIAAYQLCTNHYLLRKDVPTPQNVTCDRYQRLDAQLETLRQSGDRLDREKAWDLLRSVAEPRSPESRRLTMCSVLFESNRRLLSVAFARDSSPAPAQKPVTLDVALLLAGCMDSDSR